MNASADSKKSRRPSAGNSSSISSTRWRLCFARQFLGQPAPDLVEDEADERLGARDVAGRNDEIERDRPLALDQIRYAPVAGPRDLRDDGIAIEAEERHGGATARPIARCPTCSAVRARPGDDGMHAGLAEMRRRHHRGQRLLDRRRGSDRKAATPASVLSALGIEHMKDRADQQRVARFSPSGCASPDCLPGPPARRRRSARRALPMAAPHLQQRVVGGRRGVGRVEQQHAAVRAPEAGGELPVLALDVMNDRRAGQVSSDGTTRPTPLPLRVGAKHSTCSGPSWRR